jgi:hypothetical protein
MIAKMPARIIVGVFALLGMSVCGLLSNLVFFDIVEKVNERLPKEQQFAPLWWYWPKYQKLRREYKRLYPEGTLLRKVRVLIVVAFACTLIFAWVLDK